MLAVFAAPAPAKPTVVAAVGDVACPASAPMTAGSCRQRAVAAQVVRSAPASLWLLGDLQYPTGTLADFKSSFGPAFAKLEPRWRPAPGNHEYYTAGAAGYFDFFGGMAGPARRGYYSFNIGRWHVVSLNSNCGVVGNCGANSAQARWLRTDLSRNPRRCTAAYWHHPLYSSGSEHGSSSAMREFWKILQDEHADLVLSGHDHDFEQFPRMDAYGKLARSGMQSFVVGTGGRSAYPFGKLAKYSRYRKTGIFGFLKLKLNPRSYRWSFVSESGATVKSGKARCI